MERSLNGQFRPGLGLGAKFTLWMLVFILSMMSVAHIFFSRHQRQNLEAEITLRGQTICAGLAAAAEEPLVMKDDLALAKLTVSIKDQNPGILACAIEDHQGRLWAHSDLWQLQRTDTVSHHRRPAVNALEVSHPITVKGKVIGQARVLISRESIERAVTRAVRGLALVTLGILAVGLSGMLLMVSLVVGPLGRISQDIEAIGHGDLDRGIQTSRRDEVGRISYSVRLMAQNLKIAQKRRIEQERLKRELQIARDIQQSLLPKDLPQIPGLALAARYRAASEVGGDYYDLLESAGGRLGLLVADVSGKGVGGSMVMAMLRSIVRLESSRESSPRRLLSRVQRALCRDIPEGLYVTMFYAVLDLKNQRLVCCRAGHPPAYLIKFDGSTPQAILPQGKPLGIALPDDDDFAAGLEEASLPFVGGDKILLYTDGVTEARDGTGRAFGPQGLYDLLFHLGRLEPEPLAQEILRYLEEYTNGVPQSDDITLLIAQST